MQAFASLVHAGGDVSLIKPLRIVSFVFCRPLERSSEDVDIIFTRLKEVKAFEKFHPNLLQQICLCGYYENLEKGITCKRLI